MGIDYNTIIVTDGLVAHLDAANINSYNPNTPSKWKKTLYQSEKQKNILIFLVVISHDLHGFQITITGTFVWFMCHDPE